MRTILTGLVVTFCVFFAVGYTLAEKTEQIKLSTRTERSKPTEYYVTATLPPITPEFRWVEVYVCHAEITEDGSTRCTFTWDRRSLQEVRLDQHQYVFGYRFVPRGTLLILAQAADSQWKVLATGRKVVLR